MSVPQESSAIALAKNSSNQQTRSVTRVTLRGEADNLRKARDTFQNDLRIPHWESSSAFFKSITVQCHSAQRPTSSSDTFS